MFPDEDYAEARSSFERPITPPTVDPDASPHLTLSIACEWLPAIRGALQQLLLQSTWQGSESDVSQAQERTFNLIALFEECSESDLPFACPSRFDIGQDDWFVQENFSFTSPLFGFYVAATGFQNAVEVKNDDLSVWGYLYLSKTLSVPVEIVSIDITYDLTKGTFTTDVTGLILLMASGTIVGSLAWSSNSDADGSGKHKVWTGDISGVTEVQVLFCANAYPAGGGSPGEVFIHSIDIAGKGPSFC